MAMNLGNLEETADGVRRYASCPTVIVNAPLELLWMLLTQPTGWGNFFDVRIETVDPSGTATLGQKVFAKSGPRFLSFGLTFECTEIDVIQHRLGWNAHLPFGINVREDLNCVSIDSARCRVNYHCNFRFPSGWRGAVLRIAMHRELDAGPIDSLLRLKRAAEGKYLDSQK